MLVLFLGNGILWRKSGRVNIGLIYCDSGVPGPGCGKEVDVLLCLARLLRCKRVKMHSLSLRGEVRNKTQNKGNKKQKEIGIVLQALQVVRLLLT